MAPATVLALACLLVARAVQSTDDSSGKYMAEADY